MSGDRRPRRVLFVFAWLVVGGEETEVRLLAKHLDPHRFRVDVVACFRKPGMPEQTHAQLEALGIPVEAGWDFGHGNRAIYLDDPDGNVVELTERTTLWDGTPATE